MPDVDQQNKLPPWWKWAAGVLAALWMGFFAYLLLAADPPDFWFDDIGTVDGPGHVVGGMVTGAFAFLLVRRRTAAVLLAVVLALAALLGLELLQDRFTDRGYEASDVVLSAVGVLIGAGGAWLVRQMMVRSGKRS